MNREVYRPQLKPSSGHAACLQCALYPESRHLGCFTPESGHVRCTSSCLLRARSGHPIIYSIISSARAPCRMDRVCMRMMASFGDLRGNVMDRDDPVEDPPDVTSEHRDTVLFPSRTHRSVKNVAARHFALLLINSTCSCARASSLVVALSKTFATRASREARESKPLRLINNTSVSVAASIESASYGSIQPKRSPGR